MPDSLDIHSDPFLHLLTDALRAGPGSPEWHQAVSKLKSRSDADTNEYQLLVTAREHLESGKSYREVRAGDSFTRKVMDGIESSSAKGKPRILTANLVAICGGLVALGVLCLIGFSIFRSGSAGPAEDLSNIYFGTTAASAAFDGPLSSQWRTIGPLQIDATKGLHPATVSSATKPSDYQGGGIVTANGISANQPFAVEAAFRFSHVSDDVIPYLFVTDQPDFSPDRATSPHELVWVVRNGKAQIVLPNGQITEISQKVGDGQTLSVRIIVGEQTAQIISGGKTLWIGPSQLTGQPRYVGIRFLRRGNDMRDAVVAESIKVMGK